MAAFGKPALARVGCCLLGHAHFVEKKGPWTFDLAICYRYNDSNGRLEVYLERKKGNGVKLFGSSLRLKYCGGQVGIAKIGHTKEIKSKQTDENNN
ncbi:hypothetical protein ABDI30_11705 [Paenibacillus cisolokensis]|uniref:hypothetical protein n=1 Tax=Paenibacillus cisolokensis TaxID=1658519 RepID=UPI003D2B1956